MRAIALAGAIGIAVVTAGCAGGGLPGVGAASGSRTMPFMRTTPKNPFRLVYSWQSDTEPFAGLLYFNGTFYGTTVFGGNGQGIVFSVTPNGTETVLHAFSGYDGAYPYARLIAVNGSLYGTTSGGGANYDGTVFSVTPSGTFTSWHTFGGSDGRTPMAGLTNVNGTLYGTTQYGGANDQGTVFTMTPSGGENVIYSFTGGGDGGQPRAELLYSHGVLYGTTLLGGAADVGTVFRMTPSGSENVLHSFVADYQDGEHPVSSLISVHGILYGTTIAGGTYDCSYFSRCGTAFSLTTGGTEKILHDFNVQGDGANPWAGLVYAKGKLYGTTEIGGTLGFGFSYGTVYSLTLNGKEHVIWSFENSSDGNELVAPLIFVNKRLYGTAPMCGDLCGGSVFSVKP
jgi:uncharacterized repeat protein (TIGR03803 family)